ncbi:rRNA pseudouridine synthase [Alphaproteobacteria bacterium]|nr:rRNA pseudouridine synthase [Alphaproteobacteria bacterium]
MSFSKPSFILDEVAASERIAKRMARAGLCSRRDAENWILAGRVIVNDMLLQTPAFIVGPDDKILVDNKALPKIEATRLWRYYKPRGLVVSHKDEQDRETIFDRIKDKLPRVMSVGRLDLDSEGMILLTNDGGLARHLELPSTGWTRKYRVRVYGRVDEHGLEKLKDGITIEGVHYGSLLARLDKQMTSNAWLTIAIKEGKNREIRRVMEYLGYSVSRLIRTSYGPFQLGNMDEDELQEVKAAVLKEQLGISSKENQKSEESTPSAKRYKSASKKQSVVSAKSGNRNANNRWGKARR